MISYILFFCFATTSNTLFPSSFSFPFHIHLYLFLPISFFYPLLSLSLSIYPFFSPIPFSFLFPLNHPIHIPFPSTIPFPILILYNTPFHHSLSFPFPSPSPFSYTHGNLHRLHWSRGHGAPLAPPPVYNCLSKLCIKTLFSIIRKYSFNLKQTIIGNKDYSISSVNEIKTWDPWDPLDPPFLRENKIWRKRWSKQ